MKNGNANQESTNTITLVGHVGNVSDMRKVDNHRVTTLVMYTHDVGADGKKVDTRHEIEVWRGVADRAAQCVTGAHIRIRGRLDSRTLLNEAGQRSFKSVIVGTWIDVLDNRSSQERRYDIAAGATAPVHSDMTTVA